MHNTSAVLAMSQTQGVAQFMESCFLNSFYEKTGIRWFFIKLWEKTMYGNNGAWTLQLGYPKDILEDRHKKIHLSNPHKLQGVFRAMLYKAFQNQF